MGQSDRRSRRQYAPLLKLKKTRAPSPRRRQAEPSTSSIPSGFPSASSAFRQLDGSAGRTLSNLSPLLVFLFLFVSFLFLPDRLEARNPHQAQLSGREFPAWAHSTLIEAARATSDHLRCSASMKAENSAGDMIFVSAPSLRRL